jgi:hypothetical protein
MLATGGGIAVSDDPAALMVLPNAEGPVPSTTGSKPTGWFGNVVQYGVGTANWSIYIFVVCASGS